MTDFSQSVKQVLDISNRAAENRIQLDATPLFRPSAVFGATRRDIFRDIFQWPLNATFIQCPSNFAGIVLMNAEQGVSG